MKNYKKKRIKFFRNIKKKPEFVVLKCEHGAEKEREQTI